MPASRSSEDRPLLADRPGAFWGLGIFARTAADACGVPVRVPDQSGPANRG